MNPLDIMKLASAGEATAPVDSAPTPPSGAPVESVEEPWGVQTSVSPSGLEIYYQAGPKRLYRVKAPVGLSEGVWEYSEAQEVPSVSEVLSVLEKGGLSWWGMKVGVEGVINLMNLPEDDKWALTNWHLCSPEQIVSVLTEKKLTVNHVRDKAADRGKNVHSALEAWVETGITPNPEFFPENERGYVQGLVAFINDAHPYPVASELMVASKDGFAGRFDLLAGLDFAGEVVTKTYPKKTDKRESVNGVWLLDLKTSKSVYESYHLQLAAYSHAMTECGYGDADATGVVRLTDDGRYELVQGKASYEDFLAVLGAYHAVKGLR